MPNSSAIAPLRPSLFALALCSSCACTAETPVFASQPAPSRPYLATLRLTYVNPKIRDLENSRECCQKLNKDLRVPMAPTLRCLSGFTEFLLRVPPLCKHSTAQIRGSVQAQRLIRPYGLWNNPCFSKPKRGAMILSGPESRMTSAASLNTHEPFKTSK